VHVFASRIRPPSKELNGYQEPAGKFFTWMIRCGSNGNDSTTSCRTRGSSDGLPETMTSWQLNCPQGRRGIEHVAEYFIDALLHRRTVAFEAVFFVGKHHAAPRRAPAGLAADRCANQIVQVLCDRWIRVIGNDKRFPSSRTARAAEAGKQGVGQRNEDQPHHTGQLLRSPRIDV